MTTPQGRADPARPPELADLVAAAVTRVPGVAGLHAGTFGEAATYLPGRRVNGVRLGEDITEVHVTLVYGVGILEAAEHIRSVVAPLVDTVVEVSVQDLVPASEPDPA